MRTGAALSAEKAVVATAAQISAPIEHAGQPSSRVSRRPVLRTEAMTARRVDGPQGSQVQTSAWTFDAASVSAARNAMETPWP